MQDRLHTSLATSALVAASFCDSPQQAERDHDKQLLQHIQWALSSLSSCFAPHLHLTFGDWRLS